MVREREKCGERIGADQRALAEVVGWWFCEFGVMMRCGRAVGLKGSCDWIKLVLVGND